ncbi:MAG: hypothetical protein R2729_05530 [Bryobacteraceae bacterium]
MKTPCLFSALALCGLLHAAGAQFDLAPARLPAGYLQRAYSGGPILAAGGGQCPNNVVTLTLAGGSLPPGVELTPAGYLRGYPSAPGSYRFLVRAANACGWADREFSIEVSGAPVLLVNPPSVQFRVLAGQRAPEPVLLRISSDTAGLAYTLDGPAADWVEARIRAGVTPGPEAAFDADTIALYFDFTRLEPGTHRTSLRLSAWRGVEPAEVPIEVTVLEQRAAATAPSAQSLLPVPVAPAGPETPATAPAAKPAPAAAKSARTTSRRPAKARTKARTPAPAKTAPPAKGGEPVHTAAAPAKAAAKPDAHAIKSDEHGKPPAKETKAAGHDAKPAAHDKPKGSSHDKPNEPAKDAQKNADHEKKPNAGSGHGSTPEPAKHH